MSKYSIYRCPADGQVYYDPGGALDVHPGISVIRSRVMSLENYLNSGGFTFSVNPDVRAEQDARLERKRQALEFWRGILAEMEAFE